MIARLRAVRLKRAKVSLYTIIKIFLHKVSNDDIFERANAVAFSFTLATFPGIIFLFTLIPYIPIPEMSTQVMDFLRDIMPHSVYEATEATVQDILGRRRGGLLSFVFFFALFMSTNGMMSLISAFSSCYKTHDNRSYLRIRLIATSLTFMLVFVLFLAMMLLIVGQLVINFLMEHKLLDSDYLFYLIVTLRFAVLFFIFLFAISLIYYVAPTVKDRWAFISPGSIISTLLMLGISFGFSYYINNFGTYNKLYGSIGVLIAFMVWIYFLSFVLLIGFEVNASIDKAVTDLKKRKQERSRAKAGKPSAQSPSKK
jgi:membrane protein